MSLAQQPQSEGPHGLTLNLGSNNPFRKFSGTSSPPVLTPPIDRTSPPAQPVSRNPFLDVAPAPAQPSTSPSNMNFFPAPAPSAPSPPLTGSAAELFEALTISDKPKPTVGMRPAPPPPTEGKPGAPRPENVPPRSGLVHRPSRSQEEAMRARRAQGSSSGRPRPPNGELNIFADPESPRKSEDRQRRPRRNSESSVVGSGKPLDAEEEKKRQERRRRERRHREREAREAGKDGKPKSRKLDIIDQLDATSIYGTGLFHHDGPFDACNPHRNRAGSKRAPMQAFPKDSLNNTLGGSGPINKRSDHATFLGNNDEEAFKDYAKGGAGAVGYEPYGNGYPKVGKEPMLVNPSLKVEPVHGDESLGLGTSTFLEGAPASRAAIQRKETDVLLSPDEMGGGLSRKKSLAQKIRGISNNRREFGPSGRMTNPEGVYNSATPEYATTPNGTQSVSKERNPFFREYAIGEETLDVKPRDAGASHTKQGSFSQPLIEEVGTSASGRGRAPSSPSRGVFAERLERRVTNDGQGSGEEAQPKLSLLGRVKSLRGGRRKAAE